MDETPPSNLHCARCAYALKGLDPARSCPECNFPITESIAAANIAMRVPVQKIARGARWATNGTIALMVLTFSQMLLIHTGIIHPAFLFFFQILPTAAILMSATGWFRIAAKGAPGSIGTTVARMRVPLRIGLALFMLLALFQLVSPFFGLFTTSLSVMFVMYIVPYVFFYLSTILYTTLLHESLPHSSRGGKTKWIIALTVLMTVMYCLPSVRFFLRANNPTPPAQNAWTDTMFQTSFYIGLYSLLALQLYTAAALGRHMRRLKGLTSDATPAPILASKPVSP